MREIDEEIYKVLPVHYCLRNLQMASQQQSKNKQGTAATKSNPTDNLDLDALFAALEQDLSNVDSEAAQSLIDDWYTPLNKAKEPEIKEIANGLKDLKQLIKSGKATGHEIGEVLIEIGEQTSDFASEADNEIKASLQKLGKQLTKIGVSLGKTEDREQIEQIDSLVDTLEEDDLTNLDQETAQGAIDAWYTLLHKSEDENLQEIANGLKELKQLLKRKSAKSTDFAEVLTKLGEQTQQSATNAARGFKGPIQKLGKLLSKAGKSLE
ncbi:hypothetical protein [Fortiea contorta]|uniref:hypothetical protein n=1 Tax=Fortiea contorta TaxID=1892405 RepID=UPI00034563D8|nr:hypothetical protein [Fortiea contorta]